MTILVVFHKCECCSRRQEFKWSRTRSTPAAGWFYISAALIRTRPGVRLGFRQQWEAARSPVPNCWGIRKLDWNNLIGILWLLPNGQRQRRLYERRTYVKLAENSTLWNAVYSIKRCSAFLYNILIEISLPIRQHDRPIRFLLTRDCSH